MQFRTGPALYWRAAGDDVSRPRHDAGTRMRIKPLAVYTMRRRMCGGVAARPGPWGERSMSEPEAAPGPQDSAVVAEPEPEAAPGPQDSAVAAEPEDSAVAAEPEDSAVAAEPEDSAVAAEPEDSAVAAEPEDSAVAAEPE